MQGVQVAPALRNDENSTALHGAGPPSSFKQQSSSSSSMAAGPPAKPGSVMSSARKAFGNLTNSGDASAKLPSASKQQLQQPQPQRRAFGDITNSAVKPRQAAGGGGSSVLKQQPTKQQDKGAASSSNTGSSVLLQQQQSAATTTWSDEPERAAGKTWVQLEEERWAQMDADAEASANQVLAGLRRVMVPLPEVPLLPGEESSEEEDLQALSRLPPPWQAVQQPTADFDDAALDDFLMPSGAAALASLLPDIALPDSGSDSHADEEGDADEQQPAVAPQQACASPLPAAAPGQPATQLRSPDPTPW